MACMFGTNSTFSLSEHVLETKVMSTEQAGKKMSNTCGYSEHPFVPAPRFVGHP